MERNRCVSGVSRTYIGTRTRGERLTNVRERGFTGVMARDARVVCNLVSL